MGITQDVIYEIANLSYLHLAAENSERSTSECLRNGYNNSQIPVGFENCIIGEAAYNLHNREHFWYVYAMDGLKKTYT